MKYVKLYVCDSTSLQRRFIHGNMRITMRIEYNQILLLWNYRNMLFLATKIGPNLSRTEYTQTTEKNSTNGIDEAVNEK